MHLSPRNALAISAVCAATACSPAAAPAPAPAATPVAALAAPPAPPTPHGPMPKFVPPSHSPAAVASGTYKIEPAHTQIMFSVLHLGISDYFGDFSGASGTLTVDARHPANDSIEVSVPVASIHTTSDVLTGELKSPVWLDAAAFPTMTFKSTKIVPIGKNSAKVMGDLTLHGVTKPVTFSATFEAAGMNPLMHTMNIGFTVTGIIKRGDFGVSAGIPMVSDDTKITIAAVFTQ